MHIILSSKIPNEVLSIISSYGDVILLQECNDLPKPINHHPDSLFFQHDNTLFKIRDYSFDSSIHCLDIEEKSKPIYPYDTYVNAFCVKNNIVCGKNISKNIIEYAQINNLNVIYVNQGYAHCSSIVFNNSVITQDKGIYLSCQNNGIDSLLVKQGNILLPGYNTGFIGGSCAVIDNTLILFYGDIRKHPSYNEISLFVEHKGGIIKYVENMALTDFGGAVIIK